MDTTSGIVCWQDRVREAFPRRRDKALFYLLFVLGGMPGVQLAFALTHRNRKWV